MDLAMVSLRGSTRRILSLVRLISSYLRVHKPHSPTEFNKKDDSSGLEYNALAQEEETRGHGTHLEAGETLVNRAELSAYVRTLLEGVERFRW